MCCIGLDVDDDVVVVVSEFFLCRFVRVSDANFGAVALLLLVVVAVECRETYRR